MTHSNVVVVVALLFFEEFLKRNSSTLERIFTALPFHFLMTGSRQNANCWTYYIYTLTQSLRIDTDGPTNGAIMSSVCVPVTNRGPSKVKVCGTGEEEKESIYKISI